jgi:hypothetical protein
MSGPKKETFRFKVGDHSLAQKRGHCTACSAVQAVVAVKATSLDEAVKLANDAVRKHGDQSYGAKGASVQVTIETTITKRQLVGEGS